MRFGLPPRPSAEVSTRIKQADKMGGLFWKQRNSRALRWWRQKFFGQAQGPSAQARAPSPGLCRWPLKSSALYPQAVQ